MTFLYGGIEGGGTKFVCAVGSGPNDIRAEIRFPTTTPEETLGQAIQFFKGFLPSAPKSEQKNKAKDGTLAALGVACFGPLDPNPASPTYGRILPTPKPGWSNVDVVGALKAALGVPVEFDTDVNGAALAEWRWGAGQNCDPALYLTIGTGIGGGAVVNGKLLHGLLHPEMGHIPVPRLPIDSFSGLCPFHENCFEGLASGPAIEKRWGQPAATLPPEHLAWEIEAHYIALALTSYIVSLSPQKIILGGGVMSQAHMLPLVRQKVQAMLNGYVQSTAIIGEIENYIVSPGLGTRSGALGAIALGMASLAHTK